MTEKEKVTITDGVVDEVEILGDKELEQLENLMIEHIPMEVEIVDENKISEGLKWLEIGYNMNEEAYNLIKSKITHFVKEDNFLKFKDDADNDIVTIEFDTRDLGTLKSIDVDLLTREDMLLFFELVGEDISEELSNC